MCHHALSFLAAFTEASKKLPNVTRRHSLEFHVAVISRRSLIKSSLLFHFLYIFFDLLTPSTKPQTLPSAFHLIARLPSDTTTTPATQTHKSSSHGYQQAHHEGDYPIQDVEKGEQLLTHDQELGDLSSHSPPGCTVKLANEEDINLWDVTMARCPDTLSISEIC